jgi:molybdate transport system substrate-binding protein
MQSNVTFSILLQSIMKTFFPLVVFLAMLAQRGEVAAQSTIRIAAASDVKFALDSIIVAFQAVSTANVMATYGSSGKLFEQISTGAPFDIFFSADINYAQKLSERGFTVGSAELYATGRIVIWSKIIEPGQISAQSLSHPAVHHIAIANPQHAPYGQRAVEAMKYYKVYDKLKPKLVFGENVSQASQYLYSGAADIGIIALSMALSPPMKKEGGNYFVIPQEAHQPLHQAFVVLKSSANNKGVTDFNNFLKSDRSKSILRHFGFLVTNENLK